MFSKNFRQIWVRPRSSQKNFTRGSVCLKNGSYFFSKFIFRTYILPKFSHFSNGPLDLESTRPMTKSNYK